MALGDFQRDHPEFFQAMQDSVKNGENPERTIITLLGNKRKKTEKSLETFFKNAISTDGQVLISEKQKKIISLILWSAYSKISPFCFDNHFFSQFKKECNIDIPGRATLVKYYPILNDTTFYMLLMYLIRDQMLN